MATAFEDLRILRSTEGYADKIWKQMARAIDSIGANIAESFGRFNYGKKFQYLFYARGSLFETKYWLDRAKTRELMSSSDVQEYTSHLTDIAKQ
jgi:four helix bundle protein